MPEKRNFNHPGHFAADLTLDTAKGAVAGTTGLAAGGGSIVAASLFEIPHPVAWFVGFSVGLYATYQTGSIIERKYNAIHARENLGHLLELEDDNFKHTAVGFTYKF